MKSLTKKQVITRTFLSVGIIAVMWVVIVVHIPDRGKRMTPEQIMKEYGEITAYIPTRMTIKTNSHVLEVTPIREDGTYEIISTKER